MICKICGADMPDDASFCPKCGCNNKINDTKTTIQASLFSSENQLPKVKKPAQIARLIVEVLICTAIAFFGAMTAIFGDMKICGILMITMSGGLLWLLIKNPKIPKTETNDKQYKLQGSSRVILIIACIIAAFVFLMTGIGT